MYFGGKRGVIAVCQWQKFVITVISYVLGWGGELQSTPGTYNPHYATAL